MAGNRDTLGRGEQVETASAPRASVSPGVQNTEPRVLLIDDESPIYFGLRPELRRAGFTLLYAATGAQGLEMFVKSSPDVVLLDVGLPDMSGFDVCRRIREISDVSVIIYTVLDGAEDKQEANKAGASDFLSKQDGIEELIARLRVGVIHWGRVVKDEDTEERFAHVGLNIDREHRVRAWDGRVVALSRKEYEVLRYLAEHPGTTITAQALLQNIWGSKYTGNDNIASLRVFISSLRAKFERDPNRPRHLVTVANFGYRLEVADSYR